MQAKDRGSALSSPVALLLMQSTIEHDGVLGSVSISLRDMLTGHSQVTKSVLSLG